VDNGNGLLVAESNPSPDVATFTSWWYSGILEFSIFELLNLYRLVFTQQMRHKRGQFSLLHCGLPHSHSPSFFVPVIADTADNHAKVQI
jgi:hypothetical protein